MGIANNWHILKYLTESDIEHLEYVSRAVQFETGNIIIEQNAIIRELILIVEGHVAVRLSHHSTRIDVSILGPGDLIGEMSFVTGEVASASVVAIESGMFIRILQDDLAYIMEKEPLFSSRLYASLAYLMANRLKETTNKISSVSVEDIAHVNLHHHTLTGRFGSDNIPLGVVDAVERFKDEIQGLDKSISKSDSTQKNETNKELFAILDKLKTNVSLEIASVAEKGGVFLEGIGSYVLRETFPYLMLSRMLDRIYSKPRGFSGDYYTVELIHLKQPQGDGRLGPLIDQAYLNSAYCQSIRNCRVSLKNHLSLAYFNYLNKKSMQKDSMFQITSLASGAARELFDFISSLPVSSNISASLLDVDIQALTYSSHLANELGLQSRVLYTRENIIQLIQGKGRTKLPVQNVIYASGIAEYLDDEQFVQLLNWIYDHLEIGGSVFFTNILPNNPDRYFMEYVLDWQMNHRAISDVQKLLSLSKFNHSTPEFDNENSNVHFITLCKKI